MVVHGRDGLDEISLSGPTLVAELKNGWIGEYELDPAEFGFSLCSAADLAAPTAEDSKARLLAVLDNQPGPARDIVCMNAGAAIYVAGVTDSSDAGGIRLAQELLASGAARQKLGQLVELTHKLAA